MLRPETEARLHTLPWRTVVGTVGLACCLPAWRQLSPLCVAQVTGRVVAAGSESPIPAAQAELWSDSGLVARAESDDDGRFALTGPSKGHTLWLLVRRIGFAPAVLRSVQQGTFYTVAMRQLPVTLPELYVTTCTSRDDPVSRRLWLTVRLRYRLIPESLAVWAGIGYTRFETTSADSVGYAAHEQWAGTGGWTGLGSRPWRARLRGAGYAVPRGPGTYLGDEEGATEYMRLDDHSAEHFVDSLFGALHVFLPGHDEDGLIVIPFCPRSTRHPDIEGAFSLVLGGGLVSAWWRFVVPESSEQAGGQVFFAPPADSGAGFVIPVRGVFWRRPNGSSTYLQWMHVYDSWGTGLDWPSRQH